MALQEPPKTLAPRTKRARRTLWIGGITISLALAIIPPWVDSTKIFIQVGIIVGLVGFCIALLVEQSTKLDQAIVEMRTQMERQAAELTTALREVSPVIAAPPLCKDFVDGYVAAYQSIDRRGDIDVFSDIRQSKSSELLDCLHDLSNGAIIVSIDGPYSVRARPFDDVLHYRAVSMGPFEFWTGPFGQRYLKTQQSAIERFGLVVERIFVSDDPATPYLEDVVRAQAAAGIDTWLVLREWVPEHHREHVVDQGVLSFRNGTKLLMQPRATQYRQKADRERLSVLPNEIRAAEFSLDLIRSHAFKVTATSSWPPVPR